jgi:hypothetical protein
MKRTQVAPKIKRHPGHHGGGRGEIKAALTCRRKKHEGCLHRFGGAEGHVGRRGRNVLGQRESLILVVAYRKKTYPPARQCAVRLAEKSHTHFVEDPVAPGDGVDTLDADTPSVITVTVADADNSPGGEQRNQQYCGQVYEDRPRGNPSCAPCGMDLPSCLKIEETRPLTRTTTRTSTPTVAPRFES